MPTDKWGETTGPGPVPRGTPDEHAARRTVATRSVEEMIKTGHVRSFLDLWVQFERRIFRTEVGEVQRTEMRRAFYAGGSAMFYYVLGLSGPAEEDEALGAARLDQLQKELEQWVDALRAGHV